jgi:hypothetical protein
METTALIAGVVVGIAALALFLAWCHLTPDGQVCSLRWSHRPALRRLPRGLFPAPADALQRLFEFLARAEAQDVQGGEARRARAVLSTLPDRLVFDACRRHLETYGGAPRFLVDELGRMATARSIRLLIDLLHRAGSAPGGGPSPALAAVRDLRVAPNLLVDVLLEVLGCEDPARVPKAVILLARTGVAAASAELAARAAREALSPGLLLALGDALAAVGEPNDYRFRGLLRRFEQLSQAPDAAPNPGGGGDSPAPAADTLKVVLDELVQVGNPAAVPVLLATRCRDGATLRAVVGAASRLGATPADLEAWLLAALSDSASSDVLLAALGELSGLNADREVLFDRCLTSGLSFAAAAEHGAAQTCLGILEALDPEWTLRREPRHAQRVLKLYLSRLTTSAQWQLPDEHAIRSLGSLGDQEAVPALSRLLTHWSDSVRPAVDEALAQLGAHAVVEDQRHRERQVQELIKRRIWQKLEPPITHLPRVNYTHVAKAANYVQREGDFDILLDFVPDGTSRGPAGQGHFDLRIVPATKPAPVVVERMRRPALDAEPAPDLRRQAQA